MKMKLLLMIFLFFWVTGTVNAYTIGNDVTARSTIDSATNFTMIDKNLQFTDGGFIDTWSFWAAPSNQSVGTVYLQTFKYLGNDEYQLTGQNVINNAVIGLNIFSFSFGNQINAMVGEYIGWTTSVGTIPFTYLGAHGTNNPGSVVYDLNFITSVGDTFVVNSSHLLGLDRTYSIAANVSSSPVPEPGTLLLLGSGLAGLAVYRRRMNNL